MFNDERGYGQQQGFEMTKLRKDLELHKALLLEEQEENKTLRERLNETCIRIIQLERAISDHNRRCELGCDSNDPEMPSKACHNLNYKCSDCTKRFVIDVHD